MFKSLSFLSSFASIKIKLVLAIPIIAASIDIQAGCKPNSKRGRGDPGGALEVL
jgi:hypothetical protein